MAWDTWKGGTFQELQTDDMGLQAQSMLKKLTKLAREVKVRLLSCTMLKPRVTGDHFRTKSTGPYVAVSGDELRPSS